MLFRPSGPARALPFVLGLVLTLGLALARNADAQVIHSFTAVGAAEKTGLLVGRDGWLYGTRAEDGDSGFGTVFRVQVTGSGFEVLHHFSGAPLDGRDPSGPLVEGAAGVFYGTTTGGGLDDAGTLFKLDTTVNPPAFTAYSFESRQGAPYGGVTLASDGLLYGTAASTLDTPSVVYRIATDGTSYEQLYQFPGSDTDPTDPGRGPQGVIEGRDGFLYGTTFNGPDLLRGKVFKMAKDGTQFQVLAEAPGQIIAPPVEIVIGGDRWIYVLTAEGPGTFPADAPSGSIFRVLSDGSSSGRVHTFDPTMLDLGAPPTGRLERMPGEAGVYGLTSYAGGACTSGFGCGSVYRADRAAGPSPYPLHVFQNSGGDGISPQGAIAQASDGRLFVLTDGGGQFGFGSIYAVNHPATEPLRLTGPASVQTSTQAYGNAAYSFTIANQNGSTRPIASLQVYVETTSALQYAGQTSGSGWTCAQPDPGFPQYTCNWIGTLDPGGSTTATMSFLVSPFGSFAPACGTAPTPCVTVQAVLSSLSGLAVYAAATTTTAVTVIHPNTGAPNTAPDARDDSMTVRGIDAVNVPVFANDYSNPAERDFLSITIVTQPSQGVASVGGSLTIDYVPSAPLTGPDTFQYQLTDTFGASDIATVTLLPPQGLTVSKALVDIGHVRAGEMATARMSVYGPGDAQGTIQLETLTSAEIAQMFSQYSLPYDPGAAVSDPADFRASRASTWDTLSVAAIYYRASASVGRVSVIRARFLETGGAEAGSVVVVGVSDDPASGQVHAVADQGRTTVNTSVTIDVLRNDVSVTGQPLAAGMGFSCTNAIEVVFGEAACHATDGLFVFGPLPTYNPLTFTPTPGFSGTTRFAYASGDADTCGGAPGCWYESTLYWANVDVTMDGSAPTPPNLVATKSILNQGTLVDAIDAANGDTVAFRIGVSNQPPAGGNSTGPTTAAVTLTDTLPDGLAFTLAGSDTRCSASGQVVTCTSASVLNQGDAVTFDITATVVANPLPGNAVALYNEAVAATDAEITIADNTSPYVQVMVRGGAANYALTMTPTPTGGTVSGGGLACGTGGATCSVTVASGTTVTLTATPASGYVFTSWGGSCAGTSATTTVLVDGVKSCSATFTSSGVGPVNGPPYTMTITRPTGGTVTGAGLNCGPASALCTASMPAPMVYGMTATPAAGYVFSGWTGDCTGTNPNLWVSLNGPRACSAIFTPPGGGGTATYALTIAPAPAGGSVSGSGLACGNGGTTCQVTFGSATSVTLTAAPASGYAFTSWGGACAGTSPSTDVLVDAAKTCTATFTSSGGPVNGPPYTMTITRPTGGTVTGAGLNCGPASALCTASMPAPMVYGMAATPSAGYTFGGWTGDCTGTSPGIYVDLAGPRTCGATFTPAGGGGTPAYSLTIAPAPTGGTVSGGGLSCGNGGTTCQISFGSATNATLTATPASGYVFTSWGGSCSGTSATTTVLVDAAKSCSATFTSSGGGPVNGPPYTMTISPRPTGGTVTGAGLNCGPASALCTASMPAPMVYGMTATPEAGYVFSGWTGDCSEANPNVWITLAGPRTCGAIFTPR